MKRLFFLLALGVSGAWIVRQVLVEGIYIVGDSMNPTYAAGTHLFVNKMALLFYRPRRGDIVMFDAPAEGGKGEVKRVIAIEKDRIQLKKKIVVLNGEPLVEPYVQYLHPDTVFQGDTTEEVVVPDDHLFVLGDNRDVSKDSRDWKTPEGKWAPFVPISAVKAIVKKRK